MKMHTRLLVDRFDECFRFYRDVLGLTPTFGAEGEGYADFDAGGTTLGLFLRSEQARTVGTSNLPADSQSQDRVALIFGVESVDDTVRQLRERGATMIVEPEDHPDWGIRTAYLRDPDGNLIEINCPIPHQG